MVVDHLGYYFLPESPLPRALGRFAFPLFLFLVGYSHHHLFHPTLLLGALLVTLGAALTGFPILPLNILWSILACRLLISQIPRLPSHPKSLLLIWIGLGAAFPLVNPLLEYGTASLMFVLLGHLARNGLTQGQLLGFALPTALFWYIQQSLSFAFPPPANLTFTLVATASFALLLRPCYKKPLALLQPFPLPQGLTLLSRHTLLLYVLHVLLFQITTTTLFPQHPTLNRNTHLLQKQTPWPGHPSHKNQSLQNDHRLRLSPPS